MIGEISDRRSSRKLVDGFAERSLKPEHDLFRGEAVGNHGPKLESRSLCDRRPCRTRPIECSTAAVRTIRKSPSWLTANLPMASPMISKHVIKAKCLASFMRKAPITHEGATYDFVLTALLCCRWSMRGSSQENVPPAHYAIDPK